jgi:hypothetical protein
MVANAVSRLQTQRDVVRMFAPVTGSKRYADTFTGAARRRLDYSALRAGIPDQRLLFSCPIPEDVTVAPDQLEQVQVGVVWVKNNLQATNWHAIAAVR